MSEQPHDPLIGQEIDGYRILGVLGRGGMGIVYKAEDLALSRIVALKMIDPGLARDESFVKRFQEEARALARVNSAFIVGVYAFRQTELGLFIVMEFIDGGTVGDLVQNGPLPAAQALPIIRQMATAFGQAHSVGVIHRDIKPANIMLSRDGMVKVTDFGMAKLKQPDHTQTVTKTVAGTLYYMSPEQIQGQPIDHRSDLYALGMTTYEMLVGGVPFSRESGDFDIMVSIVEGRVPSPDRYNKDLDPRLVEIVMKLLERDPANRYQNAEELLQALSAIDGGGMIMDPSTGGAVVAPPSSAAPPASSTARTDPAQKPTKRKLLEFGAIAFLLIAIAVYTQLAPGSDDPADPPATTNTFALTTDPAGAAVFLDDERIGETPLAEVAFEGDAVRLRLEQDGYATLDTTLTPTPGQRLSLTMAPAQAASTPAPGPVDTPPQQGELIVTSTPVGATVFVDGQRVGTTTAAGLRLNRSVGAVAVRVEQEGYETWQRADVRIQAGQPNRLNADLAQITQAQVAPAQVRLAVEPSGTIQVAGQTVRNSGTVNVPPGAYDIVFSHPRYGTHTLSRTWASGTNEPVTLYLEKTFSSVAVLPSFDPAQRAILVINGDDRYFGPDPEYVGEFQLGPGTYEIEVRLTGYRAPAERRTVSPQTTPFEKERIRFNLQAVN